MFGVALKIIFAVKIPNWVLTLKIFSGLVYLNSYFTNLCGENFINEEIWQDFPKLIKFSIVKFSENLLSKEAPKLKFLILPIDVKL